MAAGQSPGALSHAPPAPLARRFEAFKSAIESIGRTVLVLAPWDVPIPLTRAWCIWEIFCSGSNLEVALAPSQQAAFRAALTGDFDSIMTALSSVSVALAEAFSEVDRERIMRGIQDTVGFAEVDNKVCALMRGWLQGTVRQLVSVEYQGELSEEQALERALVLNQSAVLLKEQVSPPRTAEAHRAAPSQRGRAVVEV